MNGIISALRKLPLIRIGIALCLGLTLGLGSAIALPGGEFSAQAATLTPEADRYQVNEGEPLDSEGYYARPRSPEAPREGLTDSLKDAAENVREKLNLDQPLPESTKDFLKQVRGEEVDIEEPRPFGK